ncbi:TPA: ribonuclease P protein component [Patescibacteria group bacterium]|nr:MAG: ribonuclease P protein component [Candidatus Gottesmanbacteria bacterium RIFCSPHIGHO2_01_FULL_43_15]OGG27938.1 MAG: ribonuclease P protein component [Candidatus Gottesmanbacteria bacterium RIFCSPLOWO2_01_FULL_42_10]HCM37380.1 ribonuclease P protein component [Patescibacteria group bacterium]
MLPSKLRLPMVEARRLLKTGQRVRSESLELIYSASQKLHPRWLVQVPKRVVKLATRRNRLKRVLHQAAFVCHSKVTTPSDFLIRVKQPLPHYSSKQATKDLSELLVQTKTT